MITNQEHYINLSTRKRDGTYVNTPVWFAQKEKTNNYFFYSFKNAGKVKRIKNFPDIKVATCTVSGKLKGNWTEARAELIDRSEEIEFAYSILKTKYGIRFLIVDLASWIFGRYYRRQIIRFRIKI